MKIRKCLAVVLTALLIAGLFAGCGASSAYDAMDNGFAESPAMGAPMEEKGEYESIEEGLYSSTSDSTATQQNLSDQKLIKRVYIDAETEALDSLLAQLNERINELGGYIESQEQYNGSSYSSYRSRRANLVIRIPAEKLGSFVEQVKGVSNVVSYNESTENVTLTYVATESRMEALEVEQQRLLELLEQAENMSDLLEIEARLTDVRYELESVTSQLRVLSNQVSFATVELYIDQVEVYTEVEPQTVWQRIGSGFKENLKDIGTDLTDFFVWFVTYSPQLIFWAVVIAVAIVLWKKREPKRREKQEKKRGFAPPPPPMPKNEEQK